jgi:hypothetical protein
MALDEPVSASPHRGGPFELCNAPSGSPAFHHPMGLGKIKRRPVPQGEDWKVFGFMNAESGINVTLVCGHPAASHPELRVRKGPRRFALVHDEDC